MCVCVWSKILALLFLLTLQYWRVQHISRYPASMVILTSAVKYEWILRRKQIEGTLETTGLFSDTKYKVPIISATQRAGTQESQSSRHSAPIFTRCGSSTMGPERMSARWRSLFRCSERYKWGILGDIPIVISLSCIQCLRAVGTWTPPSIVLWGSGHKWSLCTKPCWINTFPIGEVWFHRQHPLR